MKRILLPDNITVYKDDADHVILALQDIPIRAKDLEEYQPQDDDFDPEEIMGYSTIRVDIEE